MAIICSQYISMLEDGYILLPERYNQQKYVFSEGIPLLDLITYGTESINCTQLSKYEYLALDTSNSSEGFIKIQQNDYNKKVESSKKIFHKRSLIISRLRPYLKQIGFIDENLTSDKTLIIGSSEYYELIPKNEESIAYLVPFFLSDSIQTYLQASVEGGNHPRFRQAALSKLKVPIQIYENRFELSKQLENYIKTLRLGYNGLSNLYIQTNMHASGVSA